MKCPVCENDKVEKLSKTMDGDSYECPVCGKYNISRTALVTGYLEKMTREERLRELEQAKLRWPVWKRPTIVDRH
jgi:transposase-like protein